MPRTGQLPHLSNPGETAASLSPADSSSTHASLPANSNRHHDCIRRPRVVAIVRNNVVSDPRVLKTCALAHRAGFESHAIGWRGPSSPPCEEIDSGVLIHRATTSGHTVRSVMLSQMALRAGGTIRQAVEDANPPWIQRELERQLQSTTFCQTPAVVSRAPRNRRAQSRRPIRTLVHGLRRQARFGASKLLNYLLPDGLAKLETAKMTAFVAETFWGIYPLLIQSGADIIHAHELSSLLPAVVAGRKLGVPVIYDSHELEFARNSPWNRETFEFWTAHERDLISFADAVIAVSDGCALALKERYGLPSDSLVVVRNCPSVVTKQPSRSLREVTALRQEVPLLIFVGKLTRNRGLELMLDVLRLLPDFHLACVGPEDPSCRDRLERDAVRKGIRNRVHFIPPVAANEVVTFISQADVSVMPIKDACLSYHYCLPNKLFESAHAGVPIVASSLPDMRTFIEQFRIGETVNSEIPEQWAQAISSVYCRRDSYFSPEKLARIRSDFSAESEATKATSLYHRLLSESMALPS